MAEWVQIAEEDREGFYEEIALIAIPHDAFATRFDISFTENVIYDAPGPMAYATIELRSGTQYLLQHEYDYQQPGVWLIGRIDGDPDQQREEFAAALDLKPTDYRWIKRGDRWLDASTGTPLGPSTTERPPGEFRRSHVGNSEDR